MTAINIKNLVEIVQRKVKGVSASTSIKDLENLMELTMLSGGGHKQADSAGFDSDVANFPGRVVFVDSGDTGYFQFNQTIADAPSASPNTNFKYLIQGGTYTTAPTPGPAAPGYSGTNFGYVMAGYTGSFSNVIDKTPYASDANAVDVGDMTAPLNYGGQGGSSSTEGFHMGGYPPSYTNGTKVESFPYASDGNMVASPYVLSAGQVIGHSEVVGDRSTVMYSIGLTAPTAAGPHIQKFPLPISANSTDVADIFGGLYSQAGHSSETHGYVSGGVSPGIPGGTNEIRKVPFATDEAATDVGDLLGRYREVNGSSSSTHGYTTGGRWLAPEGNPSPTNLSRSEIQKFPFASDGNATDAADLLTPAQHAAGHTSSTHGYVSAGTSPTNPPRQNVIEKYPFASDANATDVGDLTVGRYYTAATQN